MNKKVALSLLSATVISSMAASAFAAPNPGIYMGGDVDRYYSLTDLMNLNAQGMAKFNTDLGKAGSKNIVFVDYDKKGAFLEEIFNSTDGLEKVKRDLKQSDFEGVYTQVKTDGTDGATYDPRNDIDPEPAGELKVESVSAIDSTSFKVTFNKEVASVLPSNFTVTQKDNSARFYVQSATLAEDKKSATVTLYDAMVENKAYTVATAGVKDVNGVVMAEDSDEFTYVKAIPASITLAAKLPESNSVDLDEYVTVKDAAGNVIKSGFTVNFASNVTVAAGTNVINTTGLTSVTINASITKADGSVITTGNVVIPVEAPAAASVKEFKLVSGTTPTEVGTLFLDASKVLDKDGKVITGAAYNNLDLVAAFKDQFDKDITVNDAVFESLTPTVLSVTTTGRVTPVSVGKGLVRVTKGSVSKTIELEVKANPAIAAIEAQDTLSVVGSATSPAGSLKVALKDQYGRAFDETVNITNSDATVITVNNGNATATTTNGEVSLAVQGLKEGSAKITLTVGTVKKEVTVTSTKAGVVSNYTIEVPDASIDLNAAASDATATIRVYEVDASGNKTKEISTDSSVTYELPATGSLIKATATKNVFENATSNQTTGSTVVTVKNGTLTLGTVTINVVDTTDFVKSVEVVNPLVKVDTTGTFDLDEVAKNIKMVTKSGKELSNATDLATKTAAIDEVLTSNTSAVTVTSKTNVALATVVGASQKATLTIKFKDASIAPVAFTVEVSDKTAPEADSVSPIAIVDTDTSGDLSATDTITVKFSEALSAESQAALEAFVEGDDAFGAAATRATATFSDDETLVITLGTGQTLSLGDTITFTATDVIDKAGNTASANVTFTIPANF